MNAALVARSWLVIPLLLVLVPHGPSLPVWLLLAWLACAGLSLLGAHQGRPWPGKALKWLITLAGLAGVALDYGTLIGPAGGVALLVFLSGAKLLEIEGQRDRLGLLFVGVFSWWPIFWPARAWPPPPTWPWPPWPWPRP